MKTFEDAMNGAPSTPSVADFERIYESQLRSLKTEERRLNAPLSKAQATSLLGVLWPKASSVVERDIMESLTEGMLANNSTWGPQARILGEYLNGNYVTSDSMLWHEPEIFTDVMDLYFESIEYGAVGRVGDYKEYTEYFIWQASQILPGESAWTSNLRKLDKSDWNKYRPLLSGGIMSYRAWTKSNKPQAYVEELDAKLATRKGAEAEKNREIEEFNNYVDANLNLAEWFRWDSAWAGAFKEDIRKRLEQDILPAYGHDPKALREKLEDFKQVLAIEKSFYDSAINSWVSVNETENVPLLSLIATGGGALAGAGAVATIGGLGALALSGGVGAPAGAGIGAAIGGIGGGAVGAGADILMSSLGIDVPGPGLGYTTGKTAFEKMKDVINPEFSRFMGYKTGMTPAQLQSYASNLKTNMIGLLQDLKVSDAENVTLWPLPINVHGVFES